MNEGDPVLRARQAERLARGEFRMNLLGLTRLARVEMKRCQVCVSHNI